MACLVAIPNDPIAAYLAKGEIKAGYFNPGDIFDQVHLVTLADEDVAPAEVSQLAGRAELMIHPAGRPRPAALPFYFRRLHRLIADLKPDLIRAHNPWLAGSLAVYAARRIKTPSLIYLHIENDQRRRCDPAWRYRLVKPLEGYSLSRAEVVVCVSNFVADYARRYGARRMETIYNKVFAEQFRRPAPASLNRPTRLLYVGRLDPQKAPELIIEAVAGLEVELTIIGDGSERRKLERLAAGESLADRVEFIPAVEHARIQEYYHRADIFALATHYEGFCIPVLEAMAAGLPVVASQTEPLPEILGGCGLIVDNEAAAFRAAIKRLLADPDLALSLGRKAQVRAESLDGRVMEEREVRLYRSLMG